jgi:hypothetical protein
MRDYGRDGQCEISELAEAFIRRLDARRRPLWLIEGGETNVCVQLTMISNIQSHRFSQRRVHAKRSARSRDCNDKLADNCV